MDDLCELLRTALRSERGAPRLRKIVQVIMVGTCRASDDDLHLYPQLVVLDDRGALWRGALNNQDICDPQVKWLKIDGLRDDDEV